MLSGFGAILFIFAGRAVSERSGKVDPDEAALPHTMEQEIHKFQQPIPNGIGWFDPTVRELSEGGVLHDGVHNIGRAAEMMKSLSGNALDAFHEHEDVVDVGHAHLDEGTKQGDALGKQVLTQLIEKDNARMKSMYDALDGKFPDENQEDPEYHWEPTVSLARSVSEDETEGGDIGAERQNANPYVALAAGKLRQHADPFGIKKENTTDPFAPTHQRQALTLGSEKDEANPFPDFSEKKNSPFHKSPSLDRTKTSQNLFHDAFNSQDVASGSGDVDPFGFGSASTGVGKGGSIDFSGGTFGSEHDSANPFGASEGSHKAHFNPLGASEGGFDMTEKENANPFGSSEGARDAFDPTNVPRKPRKFAAMPSLGKEHGDEEGDYGIEVGSKATQKKSHAMTFDFSNSNAAKRRNTSSASDLLGSSSGSLSKPLFKTPKKKPFSRSARRAAARRNKKRMGLSKEI